MENLYLADILHIVAQALLVPVVVVLLLLIAYAVFSVASLLAEAFTERRHYKQSIPAFINAIHDSPADETLAIIENSTLLKSQKKALSVVALNMTLPDEDLFAIAKTEIADVNERYAKIASRNDLAAKIAPMIGLMGTLIPLGPGIVAMGQGDINTLSGSLLIAFDTTVAGLVTAAICLLVARTRKRWYAKYAVALESVMSAVLQKADDVREGRTPAPRPTVVTTTDTSAGVVSYKAVGDGA